MNVLLILFNEPSEWLNSAAQFRFALVCLCFGRAFFLATVWPVRDFFCLCRGAFCACNMYFLAPRVACVRVLQLLFSSECFNLFSYPHRSLLFIALPQASFDCLLLLPPLVLSLCLPLLVVFAFMTRHTPSSMPWLPLAIWYLSLGWHKIWAKFSFYCSLWWLIEVSQYCRNSHCFLSAAHRK